MKNALDFNIYKCYILCVNDAYALQKIRKEVKTWENIIF